MWEEHLSTTIGIMIPYEKTEVRMTLTLHGNPVTKKNSRRIFDRGDGKKVVLPSKAYLEYMESCLWQIGGTYRKKITGPVSVDYTYHMATDHSADLDNLVVGTNDILVSGEVLEDDGKRIIREISARFGENDKNDPRVEIEIKEEA